MKFLFNRFRALSFKKKALFFILIICALGIGIYFKGANKKNGYIFDSVKRSDITEIISDSGYVTSGGAVNIDSPTNGYIEKIFVENGQQVKENDKLFTVKSSATAQEKQNAYSNYLSAVSALKAAQSLSHSLRSAMFADWKTFYELATNDTYEKSNGVPDEGSRAAAEFHIDKENWLAAEQKVIDQDTVIAANQAAVSATWTAYQATQTSTVLAQISGIVENISVSVNSTVKAPSLSTPNTTPVLTLATNSTPEAVLAVGQTNISKVKKGQKAILRPDSYKNKSFEGEILRVDKFGHNTAGVVTYNVYLSLNDPDNLLRSEMTVDGDIITNKKNNVLTVPNSAVVMYKGGRAVRILKGNSLEYIPVVIGVKGESKTEIIGGLTEGQQIVIALTNEKIQRQNILGL